MASDGGGPGENGAAPDSARFTAEILAALAYGEQLGAERARHSVELAPDQRSRGLQQHIADLERQNWELVAARVRELDGEAFIDLVKPFFDVLQADGARRLGRSADVPLRGRCARVGLRRRAGSAARPGLGRGDPPRAAQVAESQESFALDELERVLRDRSAQRGSDRGLLAEDRRGGVDTDEPGARATQGLRTLLGGSGAGKRFILTLLDSHRGPAGSGWISRPSNPSTPTERSTAVAELSPFRGRRTGGSPSLEDGANHRGIGGSRIPPMADWRARNRRVTYPPASPETGAPPREESRSVLPSLPTLPVRACS